jgi:hypothetical protein
MARWLHRYQARKSVRVAHRRAVNVDAGGAAMNNRLHAAALDGTQVGEKFAALPAVPRGAAEPAHHRIPAAGGPMEVAQAAETTAVEVEWLIVEQALCWLG